MRPCSAGESRVLYGERSRPAAASSVLFDGGWRTTESPAAAGLRSQARFNFSSPRSETITYLGASRDASPESSGALSGCCWLKEPDRVSGTTLSEWPVGIAPLLFPL